MGVLTESYNYVIVVVLLMIGLYAIVAKNNLAKKVIGMTIFQIATIMFYISLSVKTDSSIPILDHHHDEHHGHDDHHVVATVDPDDYANPLPHVLMLTAIVVGVCTLGLALSVLERLFYQYGTLEEDEILAEINKESAQG